MTRKITTAAIREYLAINDLDSIRIAFRGLHPADIISYIGMLQPEEICRILLALPEHQQAEVFAYTGSDFQKQLLDALPEPDAVRIITLMPHDERADLFSALPLEYRELLLRKLAQAEREDIRNLTSYPQSTVGAVMTSDYATLEADITAEQGIRQLRQVAPDRETIYQAYVVDNKRRLIGSISLRDLIVAPPSARVSELMKEDPPFVRAEAKREDAVQMIAKYDFLALPVVDADDRLVGIVTYDDAMDVAEETGDIVFHKTGAVGKLGLSIREAGISLLYRKRVFWLVLLVFGNIFSGAGIAYFEDTIAAYVALVFFLPLLIDSGGNAGSQAATLMVRALATGDVVLSDWTRMVLKEILVAGSLGLTMAVAVSVIGLFRGGPEIALVVSLTMVLIVIVGSLIGMSLPFFLSRFGLDPAAASAPMITSIADGLGVLIYFTIATSLLRMPAGG